MAASEPQTVDLNSLNLNQLQNLKNTLEEELQGLTQSYAALRTAQQKFSDNASALESITPDSKGKPMLVPLTSSLYVPGEISNSDNVIVDVGTGYYVEKTVADAKSYFSKKSVFVKGQVEKLAETLNQRQAAVRTIAEAMQDKMAKQPPPTS